MNKEVDKNIQSSCNQECFFDKAKERCIFFIKKKFPSLFSSQNLSTEEDVKLQRAVQKYYKPYRNRKQIYMFILSKQVYIRCKNKKENRDGCISYVFEKLLNESKRFNIEQNSVVFETLKSKFEELEKLYQERKDTNLTKLIPQILLSSEEIETNTNYSQKDTAGAINNYIKKIITHYQSEKFDFKSREALIDNALLHLDEEKRNYFEYKVFEYRKKRQPNKNLLTIKEELKIFLNDEEISYLISAVLYEFMYKEKYFAFINKRIPLRVIDFYRRENTPNYITNQEDIVDEEEIFFDRENRDNLFKIIDKIASPAEKIILFLKFGIKLTNKIEKILDTFTHNEIYIIRLYLRGVGEITHQINQKVEILKEVLFNEMRDKRGKIIKGLREDRVLIEPQIVEKLYKIDPLTYKEISLLFGQQPKWANKKREQFFKRIEGIEYDRV